MQKRSAEYKFNLGHEQGHLDFALTVSKFVVEGEHISISCLLALWSLCQYSVPKTLDRQLVPQKHHDCLLTYSIFNDHCSRCTSTHLLSARVLRYFLSSSIGSLVALAMSAVVYSVCWLKSIKMQAW